MSGGFWLDRPVLVTGATGFLGGWLVRRLLELGAELVCLVRDWVPQSELIRARLIEEVRVVRGDICDLNVIGRILAEYEINTIFHLAAQTVVSIANRSPLSTFDTNIAGTWRLLEAVRGAPKVRHVIIASSDKAYGEQRHLPYTETTPLEGMHPYDVSKSCADLIAKTYAHSYNLPLAITRCGNFYGGGDLNWNRIVPGTIRSVLRGRAPVVRSDGNYVRDYFYIEDGVASYVMLAEELAGRPELRGQAYNFSNETQVSVLQLVSRILALMGSDLQPQVRDEVTNEIRHQYLSSEKARRELGWKPLFTLDEGLTRTIEWYRGYLNHA